MIRRQLPTLIGRQLPTTKRVVIVVFIAVLSIVVLRKYYAFPFHGLNGQYNSQAKVLRGTMKDKDRSKNRANVLNHFADFPRPWYKPNCPQNVNIEKRVFSAIVYLTGRIDSYVAQTVLAILDFSGEVSLVVKELIFAYESREERLSNPEMDGTIEYLVKVVRGRVVTKTVRGDYEWEVKKKGVEAATSERVLIVDDTLIINRDSLAYLMYRLEQEPTVLHYPHIDSMLPVRVYGSNDHGQIHPDNLLWQETSISLYKITTKYIYKRYEREGIRENSTHTEFSSAALTGEVFVATRNHILNLFSLMHTHSAAELSVLACMCGGGIQATKCSIAVKINNYDLVVPSLAAGAKAVLQQLYPVDNFEKLVWKNVEDARKHLKCRESKWYFMEQSRNLMDIPANKPVK